MLYKLLMKRRRLPSQCLIVLRMLGKQVRDAR